MNKRPTIVVLLTVIAVLLAVNVVVMGSRNAEAHGAQGDGEPYVVRWLTRGNAGFFRVWSDGQVDHRQVGAHPCDHLEFTVPFPPVDHPFPVVDANGGDSGGMMVIFADGRVDYLTNPTDRAERCTIHGNGSPPFCMGDVDRNGETDFNDLLFVLNDWGSCEE